VSAWPEAPRDEQLQAQTFFTPMPYEVDFTGFLSNTVAPCWLERLRLRLIAEHFGDQGLFDRQQLSVIARSEIDYLRPVRMGTRLLGRAWIDRCLRASWTIRFTFHEANADTICMRALQIGAFIDPETFNPVRMPLAILARVARANQLTGNHDATESSR
jgi:acyl-CoA thioester hydrolase